MNPSLVYTLLSAADKRPHGFLNISAPNQVREVELMAGAGLVDASLGRDDAHPFAVINRVTAAGHAFLRAFKTRPPLMKIEPLEPALSSKKH